MKEEERKQAEKTAQEQQQSGPGHEAAGEPEAPEEFETDELGGDVLEDLEDLRQKAQERDEIFDRLQRTTADFLNYQKRMRKQQEELRQFAVQELVTSLLPCLDNFDHAIAAAQDSPDQALLEGVKLVEQEFFRVLSNVGIERMKVVGEKFDPNFHEAVMQQETEEVENHTVLEELRAGYTLNGRVVRAAQVKVSRRPER